MNEDARFPVVLLWHMHQPDYRLGGEFQLPWTLLHALKDYSDMAAHLEAVSDARAVVNFVPVLLEQIADYAGRFERYAARGEAFGDVMLDALHLLPPRGPARAHVVRMALRTDSAQQTATLPAYRKMAERLRDRTADGDGAGQLDDAELSDLLVGWFLAWTAPSVLQDDVEAAGLHARQRDFGPEHRAALLRVIDRVVRGLLARYRALADSGRVELSLSPYQHALLPLLIDFGAARDAAPGAPLPAEPYPGGAERAAWQIAEGLRCFERILGLRPAGCWPSEAALSQDTLRLLAQAGLRWTASSHAVLGNTLRRAGRNEANPHLGYRSDGIDIYFRDDGLSDRIGFVYKDWPSAQAIDDLVGHLERIAATPGNRMILIALDGENAWAHYANNGTDFIRGLYRRLGTHPRLRLATLGELAAADAQRPTLPPVRAGSWVHGQLLTWIGDAEKNRAWDLLVAAKRRYDRAAAAGRAGADSARRLAVCEASDWFWWPGSVNPSPAVADFDALFRGHLRALYTSLGEAPPEVLLHPFARGVEGPVAAGGVMRPSAPTPEWIERSAGVLLPLRALPSGRLDADAFRFIDFAAHAGLRVWQLLPLGPGDAHGNPFQPASACAGDTGLLPDDDGPCSGDDYRAFCRREADWLDDWALFVALRAEQGDRPWYEWPDALRHGDAGTLADARLRLRDAIETARRAQFRFHRMWTALKTYANARGILLFGDVPLFVAHDSVDVWRHRELFEVDDDGHVRATVGVPPDAYSETGQSWGYPPYRWDRIAAQDFRWWRRRFEVQAARYDLVRLDHFRGLAAWWRIPQGAASAVDGQWVPAPGHAAVESLKPVLGGTRLVAEDLGHITPDVVALRHALGIPGMRVLQFAFDGDAANPHLPAHHGDDCVCYTGTHDNDTTLGWWQALPAWQRDRVCTFLGREDPPMPESLIELAWASPAPLAIVPMQDLLGLGSAARMNRPGVMEGNWRWRMDPGALDPARAQRLRESLRQHRRLRA
ncbi:4-alpha-glucanotransferase [Fontimonas sp. SYSU GA230001]|uniref:4-alpha-glucanotransferase n=1 Tax=Fontimonas sp. SYSU GA230001 TaxID=3142450 RepID=UPI0032B4754B